MYVQLKKKTCAIIINTIIQIFFIKKWMTRVKNVTLLGGLSFKNVY